jgi:hypothetical protein
MRPQSDTVKRSQKSTHTAVFREREHFRWWEGTGTLGACSSACVVMQTFPVRDANHGELPHASTLTAARVAR